ncbi:MAG: hypothetical protein ACUVSU_10850 [Aggregatilineaceae bacterium]
MNERTPRDIPSWLPLLLLVGAVLALYWPVFAGETLFWGLPTLQFYPWREFAFAELRAGRLPAWNPYLGGGAPLLANYQTAIFYPPNWLMLALPGPLAMSLGALLHILWAGAGMWLLTGALGYSPFGRGISSLSYALSGYLIARLGSFPTHDAAAWLPWLLWLAHRAVTRQRGRDIGGLGLAVGLLLLAGHAQTAWYGLLGVGAFALWLAGWGQRALPWRGRARGLILAGAGIALGVGIAAVQLLPTAEYLRHSDRATGVDYERLTNLSYHPARLITLLAPDFFGSPADGSYYTEGAYFEDAAYLGVIPLLAAGAAVLAWVRRRRDGVPALATVPFWTGLALLGLFFALGKYNPAFRFFYEHVPTFDAFREPVRWLILTELALTVLAGAGVEQWGRGPRVVFWSRLAAAGGGGMALMALGARAWADLALPELETMALAVATTGAWVAVAALLTLTQPLAPATTTPRWLWRATVLLVVTLDLAWFADGLNPIVSASFFERRPVESVPGRIYWFDTYQHDVTFGTDEDETPPVEGFFDLGDYRLAVRRRNELRASLLPNINMLDRVPSLDNNDPLLPDWYSRYTALIEELGSQAGALLQAAGVTRAFGAVPRGWDGANPASAPVAEGATAWLVPEALWAGSDEEIVKALRDPAWNPTRTVVLAGTSPLPDPTARRQEAFAGAISFLEERPAERRFRVATDAPAYLVFAETWYPGWSATVNDAPAPLLRANLAFQAVAVPAGQSEVAFRYRINHFAAGVAVSGGALLAALALLFGGRVRRSQAA